MELSTANAGQAAAVLNDSRVTGSSVIIVAESRGVVRLKLFASPSARWVVTASDVGQEG